MPVDYLDKTWYYTYDMDCSTIYCFTVNDDGTVQQTHKTVGKVKFTDRHAVHPINLHYLVRDGLLSSTERITLVEMMSSGNDEDIKLGLQMLYNVYAQGNTSTLDKTKEPWKPNG